MDKDMFKERRNSFMEMGQIYFWTATINKWQRLLEKDEFKHTIINSLNYLSKNGKIDVFAFVIMPNHIHLIWRINELNGKETSHGSLLKYTAHEFKKLIKANKDYNLENFAVDANNKRFEFWQRDSLAVRLFSPDVAYQKLEYIHANPCTEHWNLAEEPSMYHFSSAKYYEMGRKDFEFLKDLRDEF